MSEVVQTEGLEVPGYDPEREDGHFVVRSAMSEKTHLVRAEKEWLVIRKWIGPTYWSFRNPVIAVCGTLVGETRVRGSVVMLKETKVKCASCRRLGAPGRS